MSKTKTEFSMTAKRREVLEFIARNEQVRYTLPWRGVGPAGVLVTAGPDKGESRSYGQQVIALERAGLLTVERHLGAPSYEVQVTAAGRKALVA